MTTEQTNAFEEKRRLRAELRARLEMLMPDMRERADRAIWRKLVRSEAWRRAGVVLFYWAAGYEVGTQEVIQRRLENGGRVALPRYETSSDTYVAVEVGDVAKDLVEGRFGLYEPSPGCPVVEWNRLDLTLVPGLGFTLDGRRLGRGKGYYDRLLASVSGPTCGIAYDEQFVMAIPYEPHDRRVDSIITPTRWIDCKARSVET